MNPHSDESLAPPQALNTEQLPVYTTHDIAQPNGQGAHPLAGYEESLFEAIDDFIRERNSSGKDGKAALVALAATPEPQHDISNPTEEDQQRDWKIRKRNRSIITGFFRVIYEGRKDGIAFFLQESLVTANTTVDGKTPLLAAITTRNVDVVKQLLDAGAAPDALGVYSTSWDVRNGRQDTERTPLQVAASIGHLPLVKLLVEDYHCDDSIVAPDGQIALRLAAENGHREIVNYLPSRRAGGFLRWKTQHKKSIYRAKRALSKIGAVIKFFLWDIEKFVLWTIPKHAIVRPLAKHAKWCWENRKRFGPWCKQVPLRVWNSIKKIPKGIADVGKALWEAITKIPKLVKKLSLWTWKLITERIPQAITFLCKWIWSGVVTVSKSVWNVIAKALSLIHTFVSTIINFFYNLKLKDVWNGFCALLRAIFITFPTALGLWLKDFGRVSLKIAKAIFGELGECLWWIFGFVVLYIPKKLWEVLQALGASLGKGVHEVVVWFRPKA